MSPEMFRTNLNASLPGLISCMWDTHTSSSGTFIYMFYIKISKFKAECPSPIPSFHMRYYCLPYLPPAWQPACHGVWERKAAVALLCYEVMALLPACDQEEPTGSSSLAPCFAPIYWLCTRVQKCVRFLTQGKNQRLPQYSVLRTEALRTGCF